MKIRRVRFQGKDYLFGGSSLDESGFIATEEQFENFYASFAHYYPDKGILRYHMKIGTRKDLELLPESLRA